MKILFITIAFIFSIGASAQEYNLLIGTYTNKGTSEGIYTYKFNSLTGTSQLQSSVKTVNPSYLTISKNKKFVFSVNENGASSAVSSFKFDRKSGKLKFIDKISSDEADPCFIVTNGDKVLTANYSGGSVSVFSVASNGSFAAQKQVIKHKGKSVHPKRQLSAHAHQITAMPNNKYVVTDLGEDKIYVYSTNIENPFELVQKTVFDTKPGTGPRHLTFSKNRKYAYLLNEFDGKITTFSYHDDRFSEIQVVATAANDFKGKIDGADIRLSPDGKFLYATNRGDLNTISLFSTAKNGRLNFIETISTLGKGPRNFAIDPSGNFLLVAHQYTNDVVVFNRNKKNGKLTASDNRINVGIPVCLVFTN